MLKVAFFANQKKASINDYPQGKCDRRDCKVVMKPSSLFVPLALLKHFTFVLHDLMPLVVITNH